MGRRGNWDRKRNGGEGVGKGGNWDRKRNGGEGVGKGGKGLFSLSPPSSPAAFLCRPQFPLHPCNILGVICAATFCTISSKKILLALPHSLILTSFEQSRCPKKFESVLNAAFYKQLLEFFSNHHDVDTYLIFRILSPPLPIMDPAYCKYMIIKRSSYEFAPCTSPIRRHQTKHPLDQPGSAI